MKIATAKQMETELLRAGWTKHIDGYLKSEYWRSPRGRAKPNLLIAWQWWQEKKSQALRK
jgi:hypothetical protein